MNRISESLPATVRVGPFDYRIVTVESFADGDYWGLCDHSSLTISLRAEQPSGVHAIDTFMHEVNHAIYTVGALREGDDEERTVHVIATGWTQIYRDNPGLLAWMAKALEGTGAMAKALEGTGI